MQMQMDEALTELGVKANTLSEKDRASLDGEGFMIVPNVLPAAQAATMAARLDALGIEEGEEAGKDFHTEKGTTRLGTLINKDPIFDVCFLHPLGLAAVNHVMAGNFGLSSITGRAAQPGDGHQVLHRDNSVPCANVLWAVSEFTAKNGPTRLVPKSHLFPTSPEKAMEDPKATHPDETYAIVPAGSLIVINGWTWHGGTRNGTEKPRHLVSAFFMPRGTYQDIAKRKLSVASQKRLSDAARFVIDHEAAD